MQFTILDREIQFFEGMIAMKSSIALASFLGAGGLLLVSCVEMKDDTGQARSLEQLEAYVAKVQEEGLQPSEMIGRTIPGLDDDSLQYVFSPADQTLHVNEEFRDEVSALENIRVVDDSLWVLTDSNGTRHAVRPVNFDPGLVAASGPKQGQSIVINGAVCDGLLSLAVACHATGGGSSETVDKFAGGYKSNYRQVSSGTITYTYDKVGDRLEYTVARCPQGGQRAIRLTDWICTP